jgi:AbrB family looped-hinge helix DNA binding protein
MLLKITSKRQVTFPRHVMERLRLKEGDTLSISETDEGILIKPHRFNIEKLAPLKKLVAQNLPAPNLDEIRHAALDSNLRD